MSVALLKQYSILLSALSEIECLSKHSLINIVKNSDLPKKFSRYLSEKICSSKNPHGFLKLISVQLDTLSKSKQESNLFIYSNSLLPVANVLFLSILNIFFGIGNENLPLDKISGITYNEMKTLSFRENYGGRVKYISRNNVPFNSKAILRIRNNNPIKLLAEEYNNRLQTVQFSDVNNTSVETSQWIYQNLSEPANNLQFIAINNDGTKRLALEETTPLLYNYTSSGWVKNNNFYNLNLSDSAWVKVAVSTDGSTQIALGNTGLCISYDFGITWEKRYNGKVFSTGNISGNGQYIILSGIEDEIILSSNDGGFTFREIFPFNDPITQAKSVSFSKNGQIQVLLYDNGIKISYDFGVTWTDYTLGNYIKTATVNPEGNILAYSVNESIYIAKINSIGTFNAAIEVIRSFSTDEISLNYNGTVLTAYSKSLRTYIYSTDSGQTWFRGNIFNINTIATNGNYFVSCTDSSIAESTLIETPSEDSGWISTLGPFMYNGENVVFNIMTASDNLNTTLVGTNNYVVMRTFTDVREYDYFIVRKIKINRIASVINGDLTYFATSNGLYSMTLYNPIKLYQGQVDSVSTDSTGKYIIIGIQGKLLRSKDFGISFIQVFDYGLETKFYDLSISPDGKVQVAPLFGGYVNVSYNYGKEWFQYGWKDDIIDVATSGKYLTLISKEKVYITKLDETGQFLPPTEIKLLTYYDAGGITMSSTGQRQIICAPPGQKHCYYSTDYGQTWNFYNVTYSNIIISSSGNLMFGATTTLNYRQLPIGNMTVENVIPPMEVTVIEDSENQTLTIEDIVFNLGTSTILEELKEIIRSEEQKYRYFEFGDCEDSAYFEIIG